MLKLSKNDWFRFRAELSERNIQESQAGHYVKWVRYYLDYANKYGKAVGSSAALSGYAEKLSGKGQSAYLIRQAKHAVQIYLEMSQVPPKVDETPVNAMILAGDRNHLRVPSIQAAKDDWRAAIVSLEGEIKRRNYSPRTLENYRKWVLRFMAHTREKPLDTVSDADAEKFLTELAVEG